MSVEYVIHSSSYFTVTGMVKWALHCNSSTFNLKTADKAAKLYSLASILPDLPAGVLLGVIDGAINVKYYPNPDWQEDQVVVESDTTWCEDDDTVRYCQAEVPELSALKLSRRTLNLLTNAGVHETAQLLRMTAVDLLQIQRVGRGSVTEIQRALQARGLSLQPASSRH